MGSAFHASSTMPFCYLAPKTYDNIPLLILPSRHASFFLPYAFLMSLLGYESGLPWPPPSPVERGLSYIPDHTIHFVAPLEHGGLDDGNVHGNTKIC